MRGAGSRLTFLLAFIQLTMTLIRVMSMFAFFLFGAASGFPHLNRRNAIDEKSQEDMKIEALFLEADENQDGIATAEEVKAGTTTQLAPGCVNLTPAASRTHPTWEPLRPVIILFCKYWAGIYYFPLVAWN